MPDLEAASPPHKRQKTSADTTVVAWLNDASSPDDALAPEQIADDTHSENENEDTSDSEAIDMLSIRSAHAATLDDWHRKFQSKADEVFVVALDVIERAEHRHGYGEAETTSTTVAVNRTIDGAIESAIGALQRHDFFEHIIDGIGWSLEEVEALDEEREFYAFVYYAESIGDRITFDFSIEAEDGAGPYHELRIERLSIGR